MNRKQSIQAHFRGWLPKEHTLPTRQASATPQIQEFARGISIAVVAGTIAGALLGVVGGLLGLTEGIGMYAWPIATAIIVGVGIGVFSVYLRRKLGLPARMKP